MPFVGKAAGAVPVGGEVAAAGQQSREVDTGSRPGRTGFTDPAAGGIGIDVFTPGATGWLAQVYDLARRRHQFFVVGQVAAGFEGARDRLGDLRAIVDVAKRDRGFLLFDPGRQGQPAPAAQRVLRNRAAAEARAQPMLALEQYLQFARMRNLQDSGDKILCLPAFHQFRPRQMEIRRKRVGAAPCVIWATWIGSPLPQLVIPCARQKRSSQVASQAFQKSGVLLW